MPTAAVPCTRPFITQGLLECLPTRLVEVNGAVEVVETVVDAPHPQLEVQAPRQVLLQMLLVHLQGCRKGQYEQS